MVNDGTTPSLTEGIYLWYYTLHPLKSSCGPSTVPERPPRLTTFRHAPMPALDVAPEKGGIHERLVTQVALHRGEVVGSAGLDHLNQPGILPISKVPLPWDL